MYLGIYFTFERYLVLKTTKKPKYVLLYFYIISLSSIGISSSFIINADPQCVFYCETRIAIAQHFITDYSNKVEYSIVD